MVRVVTELLEFALEDHKITRDILGLESLPTPNRTIAQCFATPNKFMVMDWFWLIKLYFFFKPIKIIFNSLVVFVFWTTDKCSFFPFTICFTFVYSLYWFLFKPFHCPPVTMWIYLSQRWNRANTSSFLLFWKVLMHWAHFMFIFYIPFGYLIGFCTFLHFERKPCWRKSFISWKMNEEEASWSF